MDRCLEKKIYDRQIKKQGMSDRVVDECNPDAHLSLKDVTNLCHDYDDDNTSQKEDENFKTPIDSFSDEIVKKIVTDFKSRLSKEPFYHESLLIDRKEKKLSQAEKRQAHRGYEMEKKASSRQTITYTANTKGQYRLVRNDGVAVTRPIATIRPIQNYKTQQNTSRNANVRSTRWIPAEVWQRQGMTAQEMTLPLDVVIPTNSSDKSNIILKAGQRVMVLKSAKGIYMQLDSGKIIAIRTSSKAADTSSNATTSTTTNTTANKTSYGKALDAKSNEVIDITADGDNASNHTTTSSISSNSNCSSNVSNNMMSLNNNNGNNNHVGLTKHANSTISNYNSTSATKSDNDDAKMKSNGYINNDLTNNYDAKIKTSNSLLRSKIEAPTTFSLLQQQHQLPQQQHHQHQPSISSSLLTLSQTKKSSQKIEITSNERLPPMKPFSNINLKTTTPIMPMKNSQQTLNNTNSNLNKMTDDINYDNEEKTHHYKNNNSIQKSHHHNNNDKLLIKTTTTGADKSTISTVPATHQIQQLHKHKIYQQNSTYCQQQQQQNAITTPTSYSDYVRNYGSSISISNNNCKLDNVEQMSLKYGQQLSSTNDIVTEMTPKNKMKKTSTENFQNSNIEGEGVVQSTPATTEITIPAVESSNGDYSKINATEQILSPKQTSPQLHNHHHHQQEQQQQQQQQQQQSAKLRLYMPQYGSLTQPHAVHYGSAGPPAPAVFAPNKSLPNYSQYYESMYDCSNNIAGVVEYPANLNAAHQPPPPPPPTSTASVPAAFSDYTGYTHHASPYQTNFQTNSYGCASLSTPVRASPYMHWTPLVTSASLMDHHGASSMFSTASYANDAAAAAASAVQNKWHHQ